MNDLERLEREVQKSKMLVHQSALKVEELEACIHEIEKFEPKIQMPDKPASPPVPPASSEDLNPS